MADSSSANGEQQMRSLVLQLQQDFHRLARIGQGILELGTSLSNQRASLMHQHRHFHESSQALFRDLQAVTLPTSAQSSYLKFEGDIARFLAQLKQTDSADDEYRSRMFRRFNLESQILESINGISRLVGLEHSIGEVASSEQTFATDSSEADEDYHPLLKAYYEKAQDYNTAVDRLRELYSEREEEIRSREVQEARGELQENDDATFWAGYLAEIALVQDDIKRFDLEKVQARLLCIEHGVDIPVEEADFELASDTDMDSGSDVGTAGTDDSPDDFERPVQYALSEPARARGLSGLSQGRSQGPSKVSNGEPALIDQEAASGPQHNHEPRNRIQTPCRNLHITHLQPNIQSRAATTSLGGGCRSRDGRGIEVPQRPVARDHGTNEETTISPSTISGIPANADRRPRVQGLAGTTRVFS